MTLIPPPTIRLQTYTRGPGWSPPRVLLLRWPQIEPKRGMPNGR